MRVSALLVLAIFPLAPPARAQSASDTASVLLAAWDTLVGHAPFGHPAGRTSRACLASGPIGVPPEFVDLSSAVLTSFRATLQQTRSVRLTSDCVVGDGPTFGGWMRNGQGEPAIEVELTNLEFTGSGRAQVGLHVGAGGRWGTGTVCVAQRTGPGAAWVVGECEVTVQR